MSAHANVRFIGFAIPTTPADMVSVGDPDTSGSVAGTYRGSEDFTTDITARAGVLKSAVDEASAQLSDASDPTTLNVFVAPEFYWHGTMGPYAHRPADEDPGDTTLALLKEMFPASEYPHFLFVFGSVISAEVDNVQVVMEQESTVVRNNIVKSLGENWTASSGPLSLVIEDMLVNFVKNAHAYPVVEVRNRAMIVSNTGGAGAAGAQETAEAAGAAGAEGAEGVGGHFHNATALSTEKYFDSNEDFLLWDVTGKSVITEQMTAYPVLDKSGGDLKKRPTDPYAIFRLPNGSGGKPVDVAVEICLDHSDHRLRTTSQRSPWPSERDGIGLHLIPSCGMQLHVPSVAARAGGWAFNCDGQYALGPGGASRGVVAGVDCVYADYVSAASSDFAAHTQLARVASAAVGAVVRAPGSQDATFDSLPDVPVTTIPLSPTASPGDAASPAVDAFFAGGAGEVHIYGKDTPLPL